MLSFSILLIVQRSCVQLICVWINNVKLKKCCM